MSAFKFFVDEVIACLKSGCSWYDMGLALGEMRTEVIICREHNKRMGKDPESPEAFMKRLIQEVTK